MAKSKRHSATRTGLPAGPADADNLIDRALAELGTTVRAGDVLPAEVQASALMTLLYLTDGSARQAAQLTGLFVEFAARELPGPDASAYLRLLVSLGPRAVKRAASEALATLTAGDVYPPEWVTSIGKPTPGQAWRRYDVTGDREVVVVTYRYENEDAEHALLVSLDLAERPLVDLLLIGEDAAGVIKNLVDQAEPWERCEQITLAEARRRIEPGLIQADEAGGLPHADPTVQYLPLARSRVRRLPSEDPGPAVVYTDADRAAAVDEFLASPQAADAGDRPTARFWAEVLTGYSSRRPGQPPAQVGPQRLAALLAVHVAGTFTLPPAILDGFRPAVTAWVRWSAVHQGLDEAATEHLLSQLPEILADFPDAYDDPFNVAARGYVRDLVTSDVNVAWLEEQHARREFAVPLPEDRDASLEAIDASDPDGRAVIIAAEFARCAPKGAAGVTFVAAARRVVEELWHDDPVQTWPEAERLIAKGMKRHDVLHALAS